MHIAQPFFMPPPRHISMVAFAGIGI